MKIPFKPCDILIPCKDFEKWSVVACDQYTSDLEYWQDVDNIVGSAPSTLRITLPEIYLGREDTGNRISEINKTMYDYLGSGILGEVADSFIYTERVLPGGKVRKGIVGAFDLEAYDFSRGSSSEIRATEGTVLERIPSRVKIRENAPLELPHIMILIDDRENAVFEPLKKLKDKDNLLYSFELMKNGGRLNGYRVGGADAEAVMKRIEPFYDKKAFNGKYGVSEKPLLVFAVGDGNHSLATAKTCWENIKKTLTPEERKNHPARWALAELVNLHDTSLEFEPIHRLVFGAEPVNFISEMRRFFTARGLKECPSDEKNCFTVLSANMKKHYTLSSPKYNLTVGDVQDYIDYYVKNINLKAKVDYIHGEETVVKKAANANTVGVLLPAMAKNDLFKTVMVDGVLPRKTFSMGHANEKRYYFECRRIK